MEDDTEQKMFTEEREKMLQELSKKPDIYDRLSSALASSIYEHDDIKKVSRTKNTKVALFAILINYTQFSG